MEQENKTKKKYKIYWGRIIAAVAVVVVAVFLVVKLISGVAGFFSGKGDSSPESSSKNDIPEPGTSVVGNPSNIVTSKQEPKNLDLTVVVDAGHGGNDAGAMDKTATKYEKDDVLKVALLVKQYLEEQGVTVIMTRSDDSFVSLDDRCAIANNSNADLFVSIHRNYIENVQAQGVETWVRISKPEADVKLGESIMSMLAQTPISNNRGVCYGYIDNINVDYQVNRETNMPSCLIELGFMSDDEDNKLFDAHYRDYARAISDGIIQTGRELGMIKE